MIKIIMNITFSMNNILNKLKFKSKLVLILEKKSEYPQEIKKNDKFH